MKKFIAIITTLAMTIPAFAVGPVPKELKDGVITVTTTDGKVYTFSSNEYAVVRRGTDEKVFTKAEGEQIASSHLDEGRKTERMSQPKNILSLGVVRSNKGFDVDTLPSRVDVTTKKEIGASVMYQRRVLDNKYIGGRADTNGGAEINVGVGF